MQTAVTKIETGPLSFYRAVEECGWLGDVHEVHSIGRYAFVEYLHEPASNAEDKTRRIHFASYIDGKRTGRSYLSLEAAMVGAVALKFDGINTRADTYFMRSLGVGEPG
jgi:hypothetical protein